jgi:hypothetical protein
MQELIYLSSTKLDRFFGQRPRRRSMKSLGGSAGPVLSPLGLSVAWSDDDERAKLENKLREVRNELDPISPWFADPDVQAGTWAHFEGNFGYSILDTGKSSLFLMTQTPSTLLGGTALLLHGSPRNLLLRDPNTVHIGELDSYIAYLVRIANELAELEDDSDQSGKADRLESVAPDDPTGRAAVELYERTAKRHDGVDYVQGLAKVSTIITGKKIFIRPVNSEPDDPSFLSRLVVASPLYIESASQPT